MNISRFYNMEKLEVTVEFLTPTFLGGADQQGELRCPPFKNLLRQWWRVVNGNLSADALRTREGELFGTVLSDNAVSASKVKMAVVGGTQLSVSTQPFNIGATSHPEVNGGMSVKNSLYLGYGAVTLAKPEPTPKQYITPGSTATLRISFPRQYRDEIVKTLQFIDAFGTIGSRNRNGYGSLSLTADSLSRLNPADVPTTLLTELVGNTAKEYPNRFGRDAKLLLWESAVQGRWILAMTLLAETYLHTRTHIPIAGDGVQQRHALGYPVTHHAAGNWGGGNGRMPSQLRLMVKRNLNNELVARILHLPHKLPKPWPAALPTQQQVWQQVHRFLDKQDPFHRIGGGA